MDIKELFKAAAQNIRVTAFRRLSKPGKPFIRQAMPFIRNEKGFRYELDTDKDSPTYNQPKRVARKHAQVVL